MDIDGFEKIWESALRETEIVRSRAQALMTFSTTRVPYILLSESSINLGDTVVRRGEVLVEKPTLILPPNSPRFEGFEFQKEHDLSENSIVNFLLVRGVQMPSLRYNNVTVALDVYEGALAKAIDEHLKTLQRKENVQTGLIKGTEDGWQLSLLIYILNLVARNADMDIRRLMEKYKK